MRILSSCSLVIPLLVQNATAQAATPFEDSIPLDIVEALFDSGYGGDFAVYEDIMDDFPDFDLPAGFEVVGSLLQNTQKRVVLATELDESAAIDAIQNNLLDDGWTEMPNFGPRIQDSGFIMANAARPSFNMVCNDEHGQMNMSYRDREPQNYLVLGLSVYALFNRNWQSCDELIAQQEMSMSQIRGRSFGVQQYMPRLEMPEGTTQNGYQPMFIGGSGGGNGSFETDATVEIDMELDEVFQHFAEQILEQGWTADTESVGAATATGAWTKQDENETTIVGRLSVVRSGENVFDLSMQVEVPGRSRGGVFRSVN